MTDSAGPVEVQTVIIGSGFGGIAMAVEIERRRLGSYVILERGSDLGGTWRDNTYPGASCDVPGALYRYSFQPHPWTRRYPPQAEILAYLRRCAAKNYVTAHVRLNQDVTEVRFDDETQRWTVRASAGEWICRYVVVATGQLSRPRTPDIEGATSFGGPAFHSARWRHDVVTDQRRVGVIGTGASAIQIVPELAASALEVVVFQRSAPYVLDKRDRAYSKARQLLSRVVPWAQLPARGRYFASGELIGRAITGDERLRANLTGRWRAFRDGEVPPGELREATTPNYVIGCKRTLFSHDWYRTLQKDNVRLVTSPIDRVHEGGVGTLDGVHHPLDVIVYATGFETSPFLGHLDVRGRHGASLRERWAERPVAHRGVSVPGFPNLFVLYGPNTNLGGNSIVYVLEAQAGYVAALMRAARDVRTECLEVSEAACASWVEGIDAATATTSYATGCSSWYVDGGANTHNWPSSARSYHRLLRDVDLDNYRSSPAPAPPSASPGPATDPTSSSL